RIAIIISMSLGLVFYAVDLRDAVAEKQAAEEAARLVPPEESTVWYLGAWGFPYYAESAGMKPPVPGQSQRNEGGGLVGGGPFGGGPKETTPQDQARLEKVHRLEVTDSVPLRTVAGYYGSRIPLEPCTGSRVIVTVYRVRADFVLDRR